MPYARKVILHYPRGYRMELDALVEQVVAAGVAFVGVGEDCSRVEEIVDELVVGDGSKEGRFIITSSHLGENVDEALEFARSLTGDYSGEVQLVEL